MSSRGKCASSNRKRKSRKTVRAERILGGVDTILALKIEWVAMEKDVR